MKLLILGAGGMAGHVVAIRLAELGHDVTGFARKPLPFCETITGDILTADLSELTKDFDAVVNSIGVLNKAVDSSPADGIWINAVLPHKLTECAKRVVHLSTDCVFSGHEGGGYTEESFRSADSMYGRSKALGELNDSRNLTIRTSIVGPDINENGIGLFNWFMKQQGEVNGFSRVIWSGVTTIVLAEAINAALERGIVGLYHLTNGDKISKFELLKLFNGLRRTSANIKPFEYANEDKSFVCTRIDLGFSVPSYAAMVKEMGEWVEKRKHIYPHYSI